MHGLSLAGVELDRKQLSELAFNDEKGFEKLIDASKKALEKKAA